MGFMGKIRRRRVKKRHDRDVQQLSQSMPHTPGSRYGDDSVSTGSKGTKLGARFKRGMSSSVREGRSKRGLYGDSDLDEINANSESYRTGTHTIYKKMEQSPESVLQGGGERLSQSHREGDGRALYGSGGAANNMSQTYHPGQRQLYAPQQPNISLDASPPPPVTQPNVPVWDLFNEQAGDQGISQSHRVGGERQLYGSQGNVGDENQNISQSYHTGQRALYSEQTTKILEQTNAEAAEPISWLEFNHGSANNSNNQASSDDLTIESGLAVVREPTPIPSLGSLKSTLSDANFFYLPFYKLSHHIKEREWDRAVQVCLANRYLPKSLRASSAPDKMKDQFPLHEACLVRAPLYVIKAIADSFENTLMHAEPSFGRVPLHLALLAGCPEEVLLYLVEKSPESTCQADHLTRVPLHYAFEKCASDLVTIKMLQKGPSAVRAADNEGWLPIHVACYAGTCPEVMTAMIDNYKESVTLTTNQRLVPLDCARGRDSMRVMQIVPIVKKATKAHQEKEKFRDSAYTSTESDLELL
mmetsp:Transcript_26355/g.37131  ORF Transcript_26355/g.37131 Transcript_26355/m.37131 type:complete len:529 (+) Transcript_26355:132-1718(+)